MRGRWLWLATLPLVIAIAMAIMTRPVGATPTYSTANVSKPAADPAEAAPPPAAPTATPAPYPPTGPASTKGDGDGPPPLVATATWDPQESFDVRHSPSLDAAAIARILQHYNSPAVGSAGTLYQLGLQYGIDPAYCLAFFIHESTAGTQGVARVTKSVGNIRTTAGYRDYQGYREYASWDEGIEDWYRLIRDLYIGEWNLTTVDQIVPVYAPAADGNDPAGYSRAIKQLVTNWRQGNY